MDVVTYPCHKSVSKSGPLETASDSLAHWGLVMHKARTNADLLSIYPLRKNKNLNIMIVSQENVFANGCHIV